MNHPIDPTEIDRLVDGELDDDARRDLLCRLDVTSDGWRTCALAFLEHREFTAAARAWTREHAAAVPAVGRRRAVSPMRMAMAASLVAAAFLAGFAARGWAVGSPSRRDDPQRLLAQTAPAVVPEPAPAVAPVERAPAGAAAASSPSPSPPMMPEYVRAQWARHGYQVEPTHRVVSVEEGGRRETFPVDGYRFQFVGRPTY